VSGPQFFQTRMGQLFFEVTMPKVADELARLNATLLRIAEALPAPHPQPTATESTTALPGDPARVAAPAFGIEVMAMLAQIAREHLGIVTLGERELDQLDFHDLSVASVAAALRAAYEAGFVAGVSETAH
jgi:hypothetical protein